MTIMEKVKEMEENVAEQRELLESIRRDVDIMCKCWENQENALKMILATKDKEKRELVLKECFAANGERKLFLQMQQLLRLGKREAENSAKSLLEQEAILQEWKENPELYIEEQAAMMFETFLDFVEQRVLVEGTTVQGEYEIFPETKEVLSAEGRTYHVPTGIMILSGSLTGEIARTKDFYFEQNLYVSRPALIEEKFCEALYATTWFEKFEKKFYKEFFKNLRNDFYLKDILGLEVNAPKFSLK